METTFFFLLDYKKTKAAIKAKLDEFNTELESRFCLDPTAFREKEGLAINQTFRALTIKSSEETTMWSLLEIFGGWLHRNSYTGLTPNAFLVNNASICTQKSGRISTRTVMRHISALMSAGIIVRKHFRGTRASFQLEINPEVIHFKANSEYNFFLVALYKAMLGPGDHNPKAFAPLLSYSGTLADLPQGRTTTNCRLNSTSILLLVHKINMESGIFSPDFRLRTSFSESRPENDFLIDKNLNKESGPKSVPDMNTPPFAAAPPPAPGEDPLGLQADEAEQKRLDLVLTVATENKNKGKVPAGAEDQLWKEVFSFYCYAVSILWPNRIIRSYDRNKICSYIYRHFKNELGESPVYPGVYSFRGTFMFRILLTKKYLNKNAFWDIESPQSYFDPDNKKGFNGTASWCERSKKMEEQNTLYLEHYKKFIQTWKDYTKEPGLDSYRIATQRLGKLKQSCWTEYFNQAVANMRQFDRQGINAIWQQHYRA